MTGAQSSYLKTLSEQAHDLDAYAPDLDKAEASKRIDQLKKKPRGRDVQQPSPRGPPRLTRTFVIDRRASSAP